MPRLDRRLTALSSLAALTAAVAGQEVSPPESIQLTVPLLEALGRHETRTASCLVREVRSVRLVEGENHLQVFDFCPQIEPDSAFVRSLTAPGHLSLLEQSFWFEVLDQTRLLELLRSQTVDLRLEHEYGHELLSGRLLLGPVTPGPDGEQRVPTYLETTDGVIRPIDGAQLLLDTVPAGDWNRARLDWVLLAERAGRDRLELSYRSTGLAAKVRYIARIDQARGRLGLLCSITLDNETGVSFANARIQLRSPRSVGRAREEPSLDERAAAHLYPLTRTISLEARRDRQVSLAHARDLAITPYLGVFPDEAKGAHAEFAVRHCFDVVNSTASGLGVPLPAGPLTVRRLDDDGFLFEAPGATLPPSLPGDVLSVPADTLPGVRVTRDQRGEEVALRFVNEREQTLDVVVIQPLRLGERVRAEGATVDASQPGVARMRIQIPAREDFRFTYDLVVDP